MNIDEVKRTVSSGNEAADQGRETLERGATEALDAAMIAKRATYDSGHHDVVQADKKLEELKSELERTVRRFEAAIKSAGQYAAGL